MRRVLGIAIAILFGTETTGCTSWQPVTGPTTAFAPEAEVDQVRVRFLDGTTEVVQSPRLEADTLVGTVDRGNQTTIVHIAPDRIAAVDRRQTSEARTAGLAVGVAVGFMLFSAAVGGYQRITSGL